MPFIPLIIGASLIGAGGGIASSLISAHKSKNPAQDALTTSQTSLADSQKKVADFGLQQSQSLVPKATSNFDDVSDFYKKILHGTDDEILSLFNAGEYTKSADQSADQSNLLLGRSGTRAAIQGQIPQDRAASIQKILEQIRMGAPAGILSAGQGYANLAQGLLNTGSGAATSASNILLGQQELKAQADDRRSQLISSIIGVAGSVAGVVAAQKSGGSGSSGSSSSSSSGTGGRTI